MLTSRPCHQGRCVCLSVPIPGVAWAGRGGHEEVIVSQQASRTSNWLWSLHCARTASPFGETAGAASDLRAQVSALVVAGSVQLCDLLFVDAV